MSSRKSSAPWFWIVFFVLLFVAIAAVVYLPRWYVEIQLSGLPPEVYELVKRFRTEPVEIPESYLTPPEVPDDLLELVETHRELLEGRPPPIPSDLESRVREGAELTEAEWEEVASILSAVDPRIQTIVELASHPDYWFGIVPTKVGAQGIPDFLPIQTSGHYIPLLASLQTDQGDYEKAFESLLSLLRLSIRRPSDNLIAQLIALALTNRAISPMASAAKNCDDVALLKKTLDDLNELAPRILLNTFDDPVLAIVAEMIRYERKNGGAIEVSPGKTGMDYVNKIASPTSATSRMRRKLFNQPAVGWLQSITYFWSTLSGFNEFLIAMSLPNQLQAGIRSHHISSGFDLLRLTFANRIRELETGKRSADQAVFIPDLLEEPLLDPFTDKPYLWDASSEIFYGVAPDGNDDGNRFLYSPTNGTTSAGDFSLR